MGIDLAGCVSAYSVLSGKEICCLSRSLSVQQVTEDSHDNEVSVTAAVMEDNAKSRERCSEENNTNDNTSSCCQQSQEFEYMNIRNCQQEDPELKLIMDYLKKGDLPKDDKRQENLYWEGQVIIGILYHLANL